MGLGVVGLGLAEGDAVGDAVARFFQELAQCAAAAPEVQHGGSAVDQACQDRQRSALSLGDRAQIHMQIVN
ncbi:hypothetical protein D3C72_2182520 [compost metagenome]